MSKGLTIVLILILTASSLFMVKPAFAQNNTNPSVSILYPLDSTVFNVSIDGVYFQLLYQTNDTISWAGYSINGGENVTCTGNVTDNSAYIKDNYQFDFGHPTLTLYANDTAGNWATPQTVTYTVYFYPDTYPAPSSATPTPTSTPTVPEFPVQALTITLLVSVIIVLSVVIITKKKAGKSNSTKISTET